MMKKEVLLDIIHEIRELRREACACRERDHERDARNLEGKAETVEDIMCSVLEQHFPNSFSETDFRSACLVSSRVIEDLE